MTDSHERWADLKKLYADDYGERQKNCREAAAFAKALRIQLVTFLGADDKDIRMFDYEPNDDSYQEEADPFRAVSMNGDYKWFLGYGIILGSDFGPKTMFRFPVWFTLGPVLVVDTDFGTVTIAVPDASPIDFSAVCELIFQQLRNTLISRTQKAPMKHSIGFVPFGDREN